MIKKEPFIPPVTCTKCKITIIQQTQDNHKDICSMCDGSLAAYEKKMRDEALENIH